MKNFNDKFVNNEPVTSEILSVVFFGTPFFAEMSLIALLNDKYKIVGVVTQPDKPQGRHMIPVPSPVKIKAQENGIPVYQPYKVNDAQFIESIHGLKPDLIVTVAYGQILSPELLSIPKYGCVNVHASLLPLYRGAAPVQWSMINGDIITGVTIMLMDEGMDTGAILSQKSVDIDSSMNSGELTDILAIVGSSLLSHTILEYCNGKIIPKPQNESVSTLIKPIKKEDGLIDWNVSSLTVYNKIRGCNPWPVAYTFYKGKRLKIFKSDICEESILPQGEDQGESISGAIFKKADKCNKGRIFVKCGSGVLEILELQIEGGRKMPAGECAHNFCEAIILGEGKI